MLVIVGKKPQSEKKKKRKMKFLRKLALTQEAQRTGPTGVLRKL